MALMDTIAWGYESITPFQAAAALFISALFVIYLLLKDIGIPPGPTGLPLVGYWPFLKDDSCHIQLDELKKKYGDVFSITITGHLFICVGSHKAIKELHVTKSDCFGDRCLEYGVLTHALGGGTAFVNGEQWKTIRKFFLLKFRDFGMVATKGDAASCMHDAIKDTIEEFKILNGKPLNVSQFVTEKCNYVIRRVLFNDDGISDIELKEMNEEYAPVLASMTSTNMLLWGNFAKYIIFPLMSSYRAMVPSHDKVEGILKDIVNRYKSSYNENSTENIIHSFIKEREERKKKGDPTAELFTDRALVMSVYQFVTDGVLTVAYFVTAYLQMLLEHPEEQEKIYKELTEVVGTDRNPTLEDKSKLPYTSAFIYEVLRYSDIFPMFPSQECKKETTINGYKIPVGAMTLMNIWSIHHDPNSYENPFKFDPSRYIATQDKPRAELPVTFGIGKRACIGEPFSMIMIYLFVTSIVKNFRLALPKGSEKASMLFFKQGKLEICFYPRSETKS